MLEISIVIFGLVGAAVVFGVMYAMIMKRKSDVMRSLKQLEDQLSEKQALLNSTEELFSQMVELPRAQLKVRELLAIQESLKVERGRITITQAELETIETRLRELEEIERELEASSIETKEELRILQKKQKELAAKNEALAQQIEESKDEISKLSKEIEISAEMQAEIDKMQSQLEQSQSQLATLLLQVEQGNEQYFVMKKRYDALDIEYAQLYEKFSESDDGKKAAG